MKIINYNLSLGWIILCLITLLMSCTSHNKISIFNEKIKLEQSIQISNHDARFLKATGLRDLNYILVSNVSSDAMTTISHALLRTPELKVDTNKIAFIYIYTTNSDQKVKTVSISSTHAFSVVSLVKGQLNHYYYEKNSDGSFQDVTSLENSLDSPLSMDEIRMLHFAASNGLELPKQSSIFEFRSKIFESHKTEGESNRSLMATLLMDQKRNQGSQTIGLYGDALYKSLTDDEPGGGSCGNIQLCPPGGNGSCVPDPIAGYMCQKTGDGGGGGCTAAQLPVLSQLMGFALATPVDFRTIHKFRDDFLASSKAGKEYISLMYVFSQFAKLDVGSLSKYSSLVAPLQSTMNTLLSGSNEDIVVTNQLKQQALDVIKAHKNIDNRDFQKVLQRMETDLNRFSGLKKSQFIQEFSS